MKFSATRLFGGRTKVTITEVPGGLADGARVVRFDEIGRAAADGLEGLPPDVLAEEVEADFPIFLTALVTAAGRMDDPHHFRPHHAGEADPRYRERLYCYELYHQLRVELGDEDVYRLDGEMDKKGHPDFAGYGKVPDYIVHVPGSHRWNLAVVEVKTAEAAASDIAADVAKLVNFVTTRGRRYHRGVMLVYGNGAGGPPPAVVAGFDRAAAGHEGALVLVWHPGPGAAPQVVRPAAPPA